MNESVDSGLKYILIGFIICFWPEILYMFDIAQRRTPGLYHFPLTRGSEKFSVGDKGINFKCYIPLLPSVTESYYFCTLWLR